MPPVFKPVAALMVLTLFCLSGTSAAFANEGKRGGVRISNATVTAARQGHDAALTLRIDNQSSRPLSLLSISSPEAAKSMIGYDTNMCHGNQAMTRLTNVLISSGFTQNFGYRYQGVMLGNLHSALKPGQTISLVLKWSNFKKVTTRTITALVVKPPQGLRFIMAPGMSM